jgi:hypothetical protein
MTSQLTAALKWGAISGAVAYVLYLGFAFLERSLETGRSTDITANPALLVSPCLLYFLLLFAFSAAGFYTGRETGRAGFGAVAGMVTLAVLYGLERIYAPAMSTSVPAAQSGTNPTSQAIFLIVASVLVFGLAASMGWLGGRPGAQRYVKPQTRSADQPMASPQPASDSPPPA